MVNTFMQASIREALEKVCFIMPFSMQQKCVQIVDEYTDTIVDMLIAEYTPKEVCTYLKICGAESRPTPIPQEEKDAEISKFYLAGFLSPVIGYH